MDLASGITRRVVVGACVSSAILGLARPASAQPVGELIPTVPPRALPEAQLLDAEGRAMPIDAFRGRRVVLNLWATWCPPCVEEMPALDRMQAALGAEGVVVIAASQDRGGAAVVRAFYARTGVRNLDVWLDPRGAAQRAFSARGLPTTILIDAAAREVGRLEGAAEWDAPALLARVRALLLPPSVRPTIRS